MDQLASAAGVEGHALLIDCRSLDFRPVPVPDDVDVVVVDSGQARTLVGSAYAERRAQAELAEAVIGPLRDANTLRSEAPGRPGRATARARHVISENARVWAFAEALEGGWPEEAGALMAASHASLRDDFEVSTPTLDALVERLTATPGGVRRPPHRRRIRRLRRRPHRARRPRPRAGGSARPPAPG